MLGTHPRIRGWSALVTQNVLHDHELVRTLARLKCVGLFAGLSFLGAFQCAVAGDDELRRLAPLAETLLRLVKSAGGEAALGHRDRPPAGAPAEGPSQERSV